MRVLGATLVCLIGLAGAAGATAAPTVQEFTVYTDPIELRPGQVHNFPVKPVALPDAVVQKYRGRSMGVLSFQLDIVRKEGGKEVRVPLYEVYNHHTIQIMGSKALVDAVSRGWRNKDPLGPHTQHADGEAAHLPHCGHADILGDARKGGFTGPAPKFWFGPVGGAEYRDADRDLAGPFRQIVDSPEAFTAILHFINVKEEGSKRLFECPCTSDRRINVTNGTIDGVRPLPFHCDAGLMAEKNRACSLAWYTGGYRCCDNGVFVSEHPKMAAPKDMVYGKFTFRIDDVTLETKAAVHNQLDVTGNNAEYDIPKCGPSQAPDCIHVHESVQGFGAGIITGRSSLRPWTKIQLLTARGHQHVGGLGMELRRERTGEVLCRSAPRVGTGSAAGDERGFIVGIPPCVFGPPPLSPPPVLYEWEKVRIVSRYNSEEEHLGVMGFWFMQVAVEGGSGNSSSSSSSSLFV